jgi:hypothetical protein
MDRVERVVLRFHLQVQIAERRNVEKWLKMKFFKRVNEPRGQNYA